MPKPVSRQSVDYSQRLVDPLRTLSLPAPYGACLWTAGPATGTLQAGILLATAAALALLHDGARGPRDTTVSTTLLLGSMYRCR